jgi:hypothetical protein
VLWHGTAVSSMAINMDHLRASLHVVRDTATVDGDALESHQALANLSVGGRIDLTALCITEEVVQGIVSTPPVVEGSVLASVSPVAVVYRAVGGSLLWRVVAVVVRVRMAVCSRGAWVHGSGMIVITRVSSCEMLQVSNYYSLVRGWYVGSQPLVLFHVPLPGAWRYPEFWPGCCSGERSRTESSAWVLTCFFKS